MFSADQPRSHTSKRLSAAARWNQLNAHTINCSRCPRLRKHCEKIATEKRRAYADDEYWGRPVPNFGDRRGKLLIVGLAPGAHGANRTGRMFTGDRSGDWLYRALHTAGFANQPTSSDVDDGLKLTGCVITAVCHCAPPDNKPVATEVHNCQEWLTETIKIMRPRVYLALGGLAWKSVIQYAASQNWFSGRRPKFGHGEQFEFVGGRYLIGSYHPSQQNTFTGRLTEPMLDEVLQRARKRLQHS